MIFMIVICVTTNAKYSNVPSFLQPIYIGFTLLACGISYGSNGGYALNPVKRKTIFLQILNNFIHMKLFFFSLSITSSHRHRHQARDLSLRLVFYLAGWGEGAFR
jgi:glycerol uptake facilitator-like aquaporin